MVETPKPGDLGRELRDMKARIRALESARRLPSFAFTMLPTTTVLDIAVTSGTFVDVFEVHARKANAYLEGRFQAICSDGTTAGEAILTDGAGVALLDVQGAAQVPVAIPLLTTARTRFVTQACVYPGDVLTTAMTVRLQVRRTAGAGTITLRPGVICGP
jgi:hypothetical protein